MRADATVLFAGKLASNGAQVGLAIATARGLGPSGRGAVVLIITVVTITTLFTSAGVSVVIRTRLASGAADLSAFLGLGCVLVVAQVVITALAAGVVSATADLRLAAVDLVIVAALGSASLVVWMLLDVMYGLGRHRTVAVTDTVGSLTQLTSYVFPALLFGPSLRLALGAILVGYVIEAFLLLRLVLGTGGRPAVDRSGWGLLLRQGFPSMRQSLAELAVFRADRLVLGFARSSADVGLYSIAATTAELMRLFPLAVGQTVSPRVAARAVSSRDLGRIRLLVFSVMVAGGVVLTVIGPTLIPTLAGEGFREASNVLFLLVFAEVILGSYQLDTFVLQGASRFRAASLAATVCGPGILVLDIVLVRAQGARGAALATLAGYTMMAIIARLLVHRTAIGTVARPAA